MVRVAYADPPYIGQAQKHYADDPQCAEVDHCELISELETYDAWALSLSSTTLREILLLCPDDVRVMVWVKPFCSYKPNVGVAYAWEPVIVKCTRKRTRLQPTVRDWVSANITLKRGVHGAKPDEFCWWLFQVLNLEPDDEFVDLFPGSGAVTRCWERFRQQQKLFAS